MASDAGAVPYAWLWCAAYDGPQISKDVWTMPNRPHGACVMRASESVCKMRVLRSRGCELPTHEQWGVH